MRSSPPATSLGAQREKKAGECAPGAARVGDVLVPHLTSRRHHRRVAHAGHCGRRVWLRAPQGNERSYEFPSQARCVAPALSLSIATCETDAPVPCTVVGPQWAWACALAVCQTASAETHSAPRRHGVPSASGDASGCRLLRLPADLLSLCARLGKITDWGPHPRGFCRGGHGIVARGRGERRPVLWCSCSTLVLLPSPLACGPSPAARCEQGAQPVMTNQTGAPMEVDAPSGTRAGGGASHSSSGAPSGTGSGGTRAASGGGGGSAGRLASAGSSAAASTAGEPMDVNGTAGAHASAGAGGLSGGAGGHASGGGGGSKAREDSRLVAASQRRSQE